LKSRKKINETEITLQKNFKKLRGTIPNNLILKDDIEKKIKKNWVVGNWNWKKKQIQNEQKQWT
jgi:hypothetical protein